MLCSGLLGLYFSNPELAKQYDLQSTNTNDNEIIQQTTIPLLQNDIMQTETPNTNSPFTSFPQPLITFLTASTVGQTLQTAKSMEKYYVTDEYQQFIQQIVSDNTIWENQPEAIYNLLQHSYMIPAEIRFQTMQKGKHNYYHSFRYVSFYVC